ncbi:transcription termination factor [Mactra antiquata]
MSTVKEKLDVVKPKQKISLTEYRQRKKSKSPRKTDENPTSYRDGFCKASEMIGLVNPGIREERLMSTDDVSESVDHRKERLMSTDSVSENVFQRNERLMSTDDVADVSLDLANMSIDQDGPYLDETTGELVEKKTSKNSKTGDEKLRDKVKRCGTDEKGNGVQKPVDVPVADSTDNNIDNIKTDNSRRVGKSSGVGQSLSERTHLELEKSVNSRLDEPCSKVSSSKKLLTGAPEVIDLTTDEESPEPVQKFQPLKAKDNNISGKVFGNVSAPVTSFKSLSKESITGAIPKQSNLSSNWTVVRDKTQCDNIRQENEEVAQDIKKDIGEINELLKLPQKQKTLVAAVKMSSLPDKGEKLHSTIDTLTEDISILDSKIRKRTAELNDRIKSQPSHVTSQSSQRPTQTREVNPDGSVTTKHQQGEPNRLLAPKQPQVIKIYPNGQSVPIPGVAGNHVPHNPDNMTQTTLLPHVAQIPPHILQQMYAANPQAMQLYGGRMTAARLREAIEKLHKQLETCPKSDEELEDPVGLYVTLMTHQRQALMWLVWRERQTPSGGILADDMGLGKTLTIISLIMKQKELKKTGDDKDKDVWLNREKQLAKMDKSLVKSSATLIIAPASLIHHWKTEVERRCKPGLLRVCLYHGPNREKNLLKLASYDIVLTTYNIISKEVEVDDNDKKGEKPVKDDSEDDDKDSESNEAVEGGKKCSKKMLPNIMRIAWERIVLDEAHNIKNHKSLQSRAVSRLRAGFRWALTGTPIQNDLLDMYSLLRFLRCSPFDEYKVWKKQFDTGSSTGQSRLNVLVKCLLLRRTKSQKGTTGQALVPLPEKSTQTHDIVLSDQEKAVYEKVFAQSRNVLKEYLKRHEEKDMIKDGSLSSSTSSNNPFQDKATAGSSHSQTYASTDSSSKMTGQHILVLLLRLRQCCCHLSLMKDCVDEETQQNEGLELTLEEQMMDLMLNDDKDKEPTVKKSSQIFEKEALSSKMKALLDELRHLHSSVKQEDKCKSVIVSQWTQMLDIVALHLRKMNIRCSVIQGNITAKKRMESVDQFNNDKDGPEVMLVSLRAGGCGLNLIGGNHLFLLDSHWNPALEDQACDRIYRVGQKKNVFIHRFLCKGTVEEKILDLQKRKQGLADSVLTGSSMSKSKLTLADLRMLFGV